MTGEEAHSLLKSVLHEIAPDVDLEVLDPEAPFQEEADIDSMDFLNVITSLHEKAGIDVPNSDYPKLSTLNKIITYLEAYGASLP